VHSPSPTGAAGSCTPCPGPSPPPSATPIRGARRSAHGNRRPSPVAQRASGTSLTGWVALHSVVHIPHRETIVLKALKKLFKPGKTPAPHHETHIEPVAAPIAPAAPGPATPAPTAAGDDRPAKKEGRQRQRRQKTQAPKAPAKPWSINDFVVEPAEGKTRFHDFPLPDSLMRGIQDQGFKYCTPIQAQVLGSTLLGHDAIGRAQTGTGKTAAFL